MLDLLCQAYWCLVLWMGQSARCLALFRCFQLYPEVYAGVLDMKQPLFYILQQSAAEVSRTRQHVRPIKNQHSGMAPPAEPRHRHSF